MNTHTLTVQQVDEIGEIQKLALAAEMAVLGSVSLDPLEKAALNAIVTQVASRLRTLADYVHIPDKEEP